MGKSKNAGTENPMWGRTHTEDARRKMSAAHFGKKLPPFTEEHRKNLSLAFKGKALGEKNHFWNGGKKHDRGYLKIYSPGHPFCDKQGYIYEHRLVMEKHLGRYLLPCEVPHHKNENRSDNRIDNLEFKDNNGLHMIEEHVLRDMNGRFMSKKADGRTWDEIPK